ncbi:tetratricopeptide repeat protein [Chryseobacterium luteum]|uniref:tetratricopeptide repeat protein n=1 Tax=Chryseobacterium luteum TaxID=421531 RepID=UPI00068B5781|nr:tetratricopeptide repeat protein [Chryseobacterium luteum]
MKILRIFDLNEKCTIKILGIFFLFSFFFTYAQIDNHIENRLKLSARQFAELKYVASLNTADQALQLSKKKSYSRGIAVANIYIAKVLQETGISKNALEYLENAEKEPFFSESINAQVETYRLRGQIYGRLQMNDLALREFYKQLKFSDEIKDTLQQKRSMSWAHQNMAVIFSQMNRHDSAWQHLMIQKQILKSFPQNNSNNVFYDLATSYVSIGNEYLLRKNSITARKYIDSAMSVLSENHSPYLYQTLEAYGDLEDAAGNTKGAVEYYRKALQNAIHLQDKDAEKFENKVLADYFSKNNLDDKEESLFLKRYQKLNDSLNLENDGVAELIVHSFIKKKDAELKSEKAIYMKGIGLFLILITGIILLLFWRNRKKSIKMLQIEDELSEKENLVQNLIQKRNTNKFNELIQLGKRNDSQFIILFKELYPDIISKLQTIDSTIKTSELVFFAMIYLNFNTKDISEYTHVTIRAVQIRKNRIRKKYNIDSDVDLSRWIQNL